MNAEQLAAHDSEMMALREAIKPLTSAPVKATADEISHAAYVACTLLIELVEAGRLRSKTRYAAAVLYVTDYRTKHPEAT